MAGQIEKQTAITAIELSISQEKKKKRKKKKIVDAKKTNGLKPENASSGKTSRYNDKHLAGYESLRIVQRSLSSWPDSGERRTGHSFDDKSRMPNRFRRKTINIQDFRT